MVCCALGARPPNAMNAAARRSLAQTSQYEWLAETPSAGNQERRQKRHCGNSTSSVLVFLGILVTFPRRGPGAVYMYSIETVQQPCNRYGYYPRRSAGTAGLELVL